MNWIVVSAENGGDFVRVNADRIDYYERNPNNRVRAIINLSGGNELYVRDSVKDLDDLVRGKK